MIVDVIQILLVLTTLFGVGVILYTKNIVHAAYALCLALVGLAGVYVMLLAELLAVVQIMLYAGGVVILLVFGVMMTNRVKGENVVSESRNTITGALIALGLFSFLIYLISNAAFETNQVLDQDQVREIGFSFLTEHVVAFELVAFVLLVALVGASYLAKMASND